MLRQSRMSQSVAVRVLSITEAENAVKAFRKTLRNAVKAFRKTLRNAVKAFRKTAWS